MPVTIDMSGDYTIWDGTSQIVLTPLGASPTPITVATAKRRALTTREMMAANGAYVGSDVKFLVADALITPAKPKPGWEVTDDDGTVYTVLEVPLNKGKQTHHLISRNLAIANDLRDVITIQKATLGTDSVGAVTRSVWSDLYANVPARLQPQDASIVLSRGIEGQEIRFTIPVSRQIPLANVRECRIVVVTHDSLAGRILDIERITNAEQIGELPRIEAVLRA